MAYTKLIPQHTQGAQVDEISREASHYLLTIPAGKSNQYRLAQLDDYAQNARRLFSHHPPVSLSLLARASADAIPGTWGFGFWNHPFGLSLGFGGTGFRLPTLPNAVWFFGASEENYLSFRAERSDERNSTTPPTPEVHRGRQNGGSAQDGEVANGFIVQSFRSPNFHPLLIFAGLALPISRRLTRRLLSKVIAEDGIQLWRPAATRSLQEHTPTGTSAPGPQRVDPTQWHRYRLEWRETRVSFEVDDELVFESPVSPNPPLGLVIWIDNQYAAFTPEGKIGFGVLENPEPAWLEIKEIEVS